MTNILRFDIIVFYIVSKLQQYSVHKSPQQFKFCERLRTVSWQHNEIYFTNSLNHYHEFSPLLFNYTRYNLRILVEGVTVALLGRKRLLLKLFGELLTLTQLITNQFIVILHQVLHCCKTMLIKTDLCRRLFQQHNPNSRTFSLFKQESNDLKRK